MIKNIVKSVLNNLTAGLFIPLPKSKIRSNYRKIARFTYNFATIADLALILLGGSLKRKERLSARLGDMMSFLYMANAVAKHFHDNAESHDELQLANWSIEYCLYECQKAMYAFIENYPSKVIAGVMRLLAFPFGKITTYPKDANEKAITQAFTQTSTLREKCYNGCHQKYVLDDPVSILMETVSLSETCHDILGKVKQAIRSGSVIKQHKAKDTYTIDSKTNHHT